MTVHNVGNMHLQDRERMKRGNFSGVEGAAIQDRAVQESMGRSSTNQGAPRHQRQGRHILSRLLLQKLKEMEEGSATLPGLDPALDYDSVPVRLKSRTTWPGRTSSNGRNVTSRGSRRSRPNSARRSTILPRPSGVDGRRMEQVL